MKCISLNRHNVSVDKLSIFEKIIWNVGKVFHVHFLVIYEGRAESHEQLFFACELGTADGECGGRWNQLLCYP